MINAKILAVVAAAALVSPTVIHLSHPAHQPTCLHNCRIDDTGLALLKHFEGYYPYPYHDPVGIVTIGFGHVIQRGERLKAPLLGSQAVTLLESDANATAGHVNRLIDVPLYPGQADALISFAFNVGSGTLQRSSLRRAVNAQQNDKVPGEFMKWVRAGGHVLPGLVSRRRAEAALYASE